MISKSAQKKNKAKSHKMFSIKWRYGIVFSLFLTFSFTCLFAVFNWISVTQAAQELNNRALTVAKSIATTGSTPILGKKMDVYNKLVHEFVHLDPEVVYIVTNLKEQRLILHNLPEGLPSKLSNTRFPDNIDEPLFTKIKTDQRGIYEAAVSILGDKGVVRVGISDLRIAGNIRKNQMILGAIMGVTMLLGAVFTIVFSKKLTTPLVELSNAAEQISLGNIEVPILKVKQNDEIKMLADSFERMRESFSIAMRRIKRRSNV